MPRPKALFAAAGFVFVTIAFFYSLPSTPLFASSNFQGSFDVDIDIAPNTNHKTSGFHFLTVATGNDPNVCRLLLSAAVLSYPPAVLLDWHGEGEYNAADDHLAKIRGPLRYFDTLPASSDDDLILLVDGYDVVFQLGPDVLLQRYHETIKASNALLEEQYGAEHVKKYGTYNTILYGPDVLCYPIDFRRPACWLVPEPTLPHDAFGPETDKNMEHTRPRWLNSGTMLGPIRDVRTLFQATMDKVSKTWDPDFYGRNSDQMYLADVWAEQEYVRMTSTGKNATFPLPDAVPDDVKPNIWMPDIKDKKKAEQHVGIDYQSRMFQTVAGYYDILRWDTFTQARIFNDSVGAPYTLSLPDDIIRSKAPYRALNKWGWGNAWLKRRSWKDVSLGINTVTRNVFPIIHFTGEKHYRDKWWERMWFFPQAKKLLKAKPDRGGHHCY
ncbi:hypothetical protein N0V90_010012 [Kalmusia sp. IMI 367209]|nr:hypothetical protein N0V90_010012 [Kalmusia sp. IMI 367209]